MTTEAVCVHHWILEATGNDAMGVCKKCNVSRLHQGSELFVQAIRHAWKAK
jgi:hypothetical protein